MFRLKIADQTLKHEVYGPRPVCMNDFFMGNKDTPEMLPEVSQLDQYGSSAWSSFPRIALNLCCSRMRETCQLDTTIPRRCV